MDGSGRVVLFGCHPEHYTWKWGEGQAIENSDYSKYIYSYPPQDNDGIPPWEDIQPPAHDTSGIIQDCAEWIAETSLNTPPDQPADPSPPNGTTDIDINPTLWWQCSDADGDTLTYDVYFGTSSNPSLVTSGATSKWYQPGTLEPSTTYYWKIVASDGDLTTEGPVWQFTTRENTPPHQPSSPSPADGATGVSVTPTLSWQCSDPDGDALEYKISYNEVGSTLAAQSSWFSGTSHSLSGLDYGTTYEWNVIARDICGATTTGPTWTFTTKEASNHAPYAPSNPSPPDGDTVTISDSTSDSTTEEETTTTLASTDSTSTTSSTDSTSSTSSDSDSTTSQMILLSWDGGDPDGDSVTYKVYFEAGDSTPDNLLATTSYTSTSSSDLQAGTTYYWKVVATDEHGKTTSGPVWQFHVSSDGSTSSSDTTTSQPAEEEQTATV